MTDRTSSSRVRRESVVPPAAGRNTGWAGFVIFAGLILVMVGTFNFIDGLVALFNDDYFGERASELLAFNYTAWGWFLLIFGLIQLFSGIGVLAGQTWARAVAVTIAMLNAVAQLAFLKADPIWSVLIITLDVIVIWALVVHGRELA